MGNIKIVNCSYQQFYEMKHTFPIYAFGCGQHLNQYEDLADKFVAIIDNNPQKQGQEIMLGTKKLLVISFSHFLKIKTNQSQVFITTLAFQAIIEQMNSIRSLKGMRCYIGYMVKNHYSTYKLEFPTGIIKIPPKIHYCWFGGEPIPEEYKKYIDSWSRFCPDYEIIRWDDSNYDVHKNKYMSQAYEHKYWAFVSDVARVDIVYQEGGIYLDTDVELIKSLDKLRRTEMFCGFESAEYIAFGLGFGAIAKHVVLKELLTVYNSMSFINEDGTYNLTPCPIYQTEVMKHHGIEPNGRLQVRENIAVYPQECLAPITFHRPLGRITSNTFSIHHYAASWETEDERRKIVEGKERMEIIRKNVEELNRYMEKCNLTYLCIED